MMHRLSKKQKEVFDYLKTFPDDLAPSYEEIKVCCGFKSKSQVHAVLTRLKERGRIDWLPNRPRSLRILDPIGKSEIERNVINRMINVLEKTPKCETAALKLRTMLTRIELSR